MEIVIALIAGVITGFVGSYIAKEKNRSSSEGFWFGFLLSVIGLIIVALMPTRERPFDYYKKVDYYKKASVKYSSENNFSKKAIFLFYLIFFIILARVVYIAFSSSEYSDNRILTPNTNSTSTPILKKEINREELIISKKNKAKIAKENEAKIAKKKVKQAIANKERKEIAQKFELRNYRILKKLKDSFITDKSLNIAKMLLTDEENKSYIPLFFQDLDSDSIQFEPHKYLRTSLNVRVATLYFYSSKGERERLLKVNFKEDSPYIKNLHLSITRQEEKNQKDIEKLIVHLALEEFGFNKSGLEEISKYILSKGNDAKEIYLSEANLDKQSYDFGYRSVVVVLNDGTDYIIDGKYFISKLNYSHK